MIYLDIQFSKNCKASSSLDDADWYAALVFCPQVLQIRWIASEAFPLHLRFKARPCPSSLCNLINSTMIGSWTIRANTWCDVFAVCVRVRAFLNLSSLSHRAFSCHTRAQIDLRWCLYVVTSFICYNKTASANSWFCRICTRPRSKHRTVLTTRRASCGYRLNYFYDFDQQSLSSLIAC